MIGAPAVHSRVVFYRDDTGRLLHARIESTDPAEVERIARQFELMERRSREQEERWRASVVTFTDADVPGGQVSEAAAGRPSQAGYPWEGPRFDFAHLMGEGAVWSGPESLWLYETDGEKGRWVCRFCGHKRRGPDVTAYCLGCDRSGRDAVIPKGRPRTEARRRKDDGLKGGKGK